MATRRHNNKVIQNTRSVLGDLLGEMGISDKLEQHRVWQIWEQAVGQQIAGFAAPAKIRDNVLEVKVASAVWMQQLQLLKPRLLKQINAHLGSVPIRDLYLRRGDVNSGQKEEVPPTPPLPQLDNEERQQIHDIIGSIKDSEVRTALERLLSKQKRLDKLTEDE